MKTTDYNYQFKIEQIKEQLSKTNSFSKKESEHLSLLIKKNLEENTRTLLAISEKKVIVFQLDIGLALTGNLDKVFFNSSNIYLASTDKNNMFKVKLTNISYALAKNKSKELNLPAKKSIVQSLIRNQMGRVAVNKFNIREYKQLFINKGNEVMANLIQNAIKNNEF